MKHDAVFPDEVDEVRRRIPRESGLMKILVFGNEIVRCRVEVREVTTSASGDFDFLTDGIVVLEDRYVPPAVAGLDGAHQAGGATSDDDNVEIHAGFIVCSLG